MRLTKVHFSLIILLVLSNGLHLWQREQDAEKMRQALAVQVNMTLHYLNAFALSATSPTADWNNRAFRLDVYRYIASGKHYLSPHKHFPVSLQVMQQEPFIGLNCFNGDSM